VSRRKAHSDTKPSDVCFEFSKTPVFARPRLIRIVAVERQIWFVKGWDQFMQLCDDISHINFQEIYGLFALEGSSKRLLSSAEDVPADE